MNNAKCVTIVCVYNNKELFEKQLLSSLMNQDVDYEIIGIDNNKEKFSSAAEALNAGAKEKIKTHFGTYTSGPEYKKETFLLWYCNRKLRRIGLN